MRWQHVISAALAASVMAPAFTREWRSADGKRTFMADFTALKDGKVAVTSTDKKPLVLDLMQLSPEDQAFARAAQQCLEEASRLVPITFEVQHMLDEGWLCLAGKQDPPKTGTWIFSGTPFLWLPHAAKSAKPGDRVEQQRIFPAGLRTLHPRDGAPLLIRAYAGDVETATADTLAVLTADGGGAAEQAPPIYEPRIETSVVHGLGLAVGKAGQVLVDAGLLKDAESIVIHVDKNPFPAKVEKHSGKQRFALLSCGATLEPGRFAPRKELELGQPVFAVSFVLGSTKKSLTQPVVSKGIISRPAGKGGAEFQHDAALVEDALGGYIVGEKGDVLGVFFGSLQPPAKNTRDSPGGDTPAALNTALSSDTMTAFLEPIPGLNAPRAAASADLERCVESLRATSVLVTVTRKIIRQAGGAAGGAFSLSSSGVRHNAQCRYFRADKPCGPNDGKPCGICGG